MMLKSLNKNDGSGRVAAINQLSCFPAPPSSTIVIRSLRTPPLPPYIKNSVRFKLDISVSTVLICKTKSQSTVPHPIMRIFYVIRKKILFILKNFIYLNLNTPHGHGGSAASAFSIFFSAKIKNTRA